MILPLITLATIRLHDSINILALYYYNKVRDRYLTHLCPGKSKLLYFEDHFSTLQVPRDRVVNGRQVLLSPRRTPVTEG